MSEIERFNLFEGHLDDLRGNYPESYGLHVEDRWQKTLRRYWQIAQGFSDDEIRRAINRCERDFQKDFPKGYQFRQELESERRLSEGARPIDPVPQSRPSPDSPLEQVARRIEKGDEKNPAAAVVAAMDKAWPGLARVFAKSVPTPNEGDFCERCGGTKANHGTLGGSCPERYGSQ